MDEEKKNIIQLMLGFVRRANGDHVSAYAAQAAYFLIMSFIPFILFLTTLIRYTPLSYNVVRDAIVGFVPGNLQTFVLSIVVEVYKRSTAIVPLSALMHLHTAVLIFPYPPSWNISLISLKRIKKMNSPLLLILTSLR